MRLFNDVAFAQAIEGRVLAVAPLDVCTVSIMNISYVPEPIVDKSQRRLVIRRLHSSAPIVAAHDHVFDPQDVDRVLQYG